MYLLGIWSLFVCIWCFTLGGLLLVHNRLLSIRSDISNSALVMWCGAVHAALLHDNRTPINRCVAQVSQRMDK